MARARTLCLAISLAAALSCSTWRVPTRVLEASADPAPLAEIRAIESAFEGFQTGLNAAEIRSLSRAIQEEARLNRIDVELILALIHVESAFDNFARSHAGALGLMQVMPGTGEMLAARFGLDWRGPDSLFDPVLNVRLGCRYLALLRQRYGHLETALAAYNWGPGAIDRRIAQGGGVPERYPELVLTRLNAQSSSAAAVR